MSKIKYSSYTFYPCRCGGEIFEEWDAYGNDITCDSCDTPVPRDEEFIEIDMSKHAQLDINHPNDDLPF